MKTHRIRKVVSLPGLALLVLGLLLGQAAPVQAFSNVLYVAPGSSCTGTPNCYATVQAALDVAADGIEIRVAAGTYTDIHDCPRNDIITTGTAKAVVCISKTVTIRGGYNTSFSAWDPAVNVTTLNAQNLGRGIYITGDISPTIADLSITGGDATGLTGYEYYGQYDAGGGVYILTANATLVNNHIFNNTSPSHAGGVYIGNSTSQLTGNTISNNTIDSGGGAGVVLFRSAATLTGNKILNNTSSNVAGGVYALYADATLVNNTISGNTTTINGGGIDIASCNPSLSGNIITGNTAQWGGGIVLWYSDSILTNNVIENNQVSTIGSGSGIWIGGSTLTLLHTTISHNTGGDGSGVFATDDNQETRPTYSHITMKNSIVANQTVGIKAQTGSSVNLDGVLWYNNGTSNTSGAGVTVTHPYSGDPSFAADGYHLVTGSAAIDQGVNAGVTTDLDGQPRLDAPDLGADEYWAPGFPKYIYLSLILR